jgi:hypothetical protein
LSFEWRRPSIKNLNLFALVTPSIYPQLPNMYNV